MKYHNRILSFILAVVMTFTFAMPASAAVPDFDLENAWVISDPSDTGESEEIPADDKDYPVDSGTQPEDPPADELEKPPEKLPEDLPAEPEAQSETTATPTTATLGTSGTLSNAELLALFEQWASGLHLAGMGGISLFSLPGDSGNIVRTTININPYNVTVPGVGNAYGSIMLRMKIKGQDAFCTQIWRMAGDGVYVAGEVTSGNAATAQIIANFEASPRLNADYVAAQVLVWESLYGDIGLYSQIIQGTSYESNYNAIKNGTATGSGLLFWVSGANDQEIVTSATNVPKPPGGGDEEEEEIPPTETVTTTSTRTEVRTDTTYEYSDAIGQITICKRDNEGKSLDGAIFNIEIEFANGQKGGDSAFEVYNGSRLLSVYWG